MRIQGPAFVHGPQAVNSPHRISSSASTAGAASSRETDQVMISPEAEMLSRVRDLPEIRTDKVAAIKAQIAAGVYETDAKLNIALDRLFDEIG